MHEAFATADIQYSYLQLGMNFCNSIKDANEILKQNFIKDVIPREGLQRKSFVVALRSKSYNKDWERKARPEPHNNFKFYGNVVAKVSPK